MKKILRTLVNISWQLHHIKDNTARMVHALERIAELREGAADKPLKSDAVQGDPEDLPPEGIEDIPTWHHFRSAMERMHSLMTNGKDLGCPLEQIQKQQEEGR